MRIPNNIALGATAVILAAALWSLDGTFLTPRLFTLPTTLVVFLEHILGLAALWPFLWLRRSDFRLITRQQWLTIFWVALFGGALGTIFFTKALFLTGFQDLSVVIILQKLQPLLAITLAVIFLRERFPPRFYWHALIAVAGGYLVAFKDPFTIQAVLKTPVMVAGFSLLAAFSWGSSTTFGKYALKNIHYGLLAALRFGFTTLIMLALAWPELGNVAVVTGTQWKIFVLIALTSGAGAMYIYYYGLKKIPASLSALCELAWPFLAVIFDYFLNHTVLSLTQYLGAAALLVAVYLVVRVMQPRTIQGVVRAGHQRGEEVGAKTANLDLQLAKNLPKGLYTAEATVAGKQYSGLLYYGINSLSGQDCLEVHLLNFSGHLYGQQLTVTTERYLRMPKHFESTEELARQIQNDLRNSRLMNGDKK